MCVNSTPNNRLMVIFTPGGVVSDLSAIKNRIQRPFLVFFGHLTDTRQEKKVRYKTERAFLARSVDWPKRGNRKFRTTIFCFSREKIDARKFDGFFGPFCRVSVKPFQISFLSEFYMKIMLWVRWVYSLFERMRLKRKTMFIHTNQPLIISFYIKRYLFFRISDASALIRNFMHNGGVRG